MELDEQDSYKIQRFSGNERVKAADATEIVTSFLESVLPENADKIGKGNKILSSWKSILESIRTKPKDGESPEQMGRNLASHSRVIDLKNGILLVEADHSAWIQLLQINQRYILGSLNRRFPELGISTLAFRVRGSKATLANATEDYERNLRIERKRQALLYDWEEHYLDERGFSKPVIEPERELPPILKTMFDDIRKGILERDAEESNDDFAY